MRAPRRNPDAIKLGDRFGRWTVTEPYYRRGDKNNDAWFPVQCDCGTKGEVRFRALGVSHHLSCGCLQRESQTRTFTTHGGSGTRLYSIWRGLAQRCDNPHDTSYRNYGARGIGVCPEWATYEPFRDWSLGHGYGDKLDLDREDNDGDYTPENCRWVTRSINLRNTRRTRRLTAWGETKALYDWAEDNRCTIGKRTFETRIRLGWDPEMAMTASLNTKRPHG